MATITTRAGKGSPLTNTEVDNNFTNINTELGQKESASNKGVANGYASLDGSGKVPSTQLPSYVDDVVEGANLAAFPGTGETGKIYVAIDSGKTYRWSGSAYVEISASPGSTDAVPEGSTNLYFTNARARAAVSASGSLSYNTSTGIFSYTQPTNVSTFTNDSGYLTGITGTQVATALGYTPPQPNGTGASGTWGISITGNAATATSATDSTKLPLSGGTLTGALSGTTASFSGAVTWGSGSSVMNAGHPRSLRIGYSGGNYGAAGYGIDFTTSSSVHNYAINDIVSYWEAYDGITVRAAAAGTVGTAISWTNVLDARRSNTNMTFKGNVVLDANNYNSYAPTLTGTGASGSWGISVTGNAATATTLQTARTINGTSFNGSANITTANWGTARTLTIGATGKSVDGSGNVSWTLGEIGAVGSGNTMTINAEYSGTVAQNQTGWYTIASYGSGRAEATFHLSDQDSSRHNYVRANIVWSYGYGGIVVDTSGRHGVSTIRNIRLLYNTSDRTYGGVKVQVYCEGTSDQAWTLRVRQETTTTTGWGNFTEVTPVLEGTPAGWAEGYQAYYVNEQGQISTSSSSAYFAGNLALHAGNYNSYAPTLTGGGASGTWGISITGNAATATSATDSTKLPLSGGTLTGNLTLSGFANPHITLTTSGGSYSYVELYDGSSNGYLIKNASSATSNGVIAGALYLYTDNSKPVQIVHNGSPNAAFLSGGDVHIRGQIYAAGNGASTGSQVLHAGNYNSYSPTLTGTGASGTWGINITGNAATATSADQIDGWGFVNTGSNAGVNADTIDSNGISYYTAGVTNFSGNSTDGALYSQRYNSNWQHQIAADYRSGQIALRGKNNGTWQSWRTVLDSSNYSSYALPLSGGTLTGTIYVSTSGSGSAARALRVGPSGGSPGSFGSYSGSWRSTIEIWDNAATRMLHLTPPDGTNYNYSSIKSTDAGLKIDVGGSGGTNAVTFEANGVANFPQGLQQGGNQVLHAGNYNSFAPTLTGGNASGTWGINITGNAATVTNGITTGNYTSYVVAKSGGSFTGVVTGISPSVQSAISGVNAWNAAFRTEETNVGTTAGYIPGFGQTSVYTSGYRSHMVLGSYRTASGWGGGPFLAWGGSDNNTTEAWVFNTGGTITHTSGRTVLDSSNYSSYALPLSGGTVTGFLGVGGNPGSDDGSWGARLNVGGNPHARIDARCANDGIVTTVYSHQGQNRGYVGTMSNHRLALGVNGSEVQSVYSGYSESIGSYRAPIFYDSNNTGYYMDPSSSGNVQGNWEFSATDNSSTSYSVAAIELRESNKGGSTSYLAPRLAFHWGGVVASQISIDSAGAITIRNNPGTGFENLIGNILYADASVRAPIFYDSNNTAYYVDPAGSTALNINGGITFAASNPSISAPSYFVAPGGAYFNSGTVYMEANLKARGGIGNDSGAALTLTGGTSGYTQINGSARSPIFYDSDNTGYYLDPTSTTSLRTVGSWRADSAAWDGEFSGKIQYHSSYWYLQSYNGWFLRNSGGSNVVTVDSSGNLTANGNVTAYSDRRLKDNVRDLTGARAYLDKISAKRFTWKDDGYEDIGFIAQDVEAAGLTEFVLETADYDPNTETTSDPVKSLDYGRMVSVLWQAVKEQELQISSMSDEIKSLKERLH